MLVFFDSPYIQNITQYNSERTNQFLSSKKKEEKMKSYLWRGWGKWERGKDGGKESEVVYRRGKLYNGGKVREYEN